MRDPGDGTTNPSPRPAPHPPIGSFADLNIATGTRIRVLRDNGRRGLIGLEGVVVQSLPGAVIVELVGDPLLKFRASMKSGFETIKITPRRHFRVTEVERI